MSTVKEEKLKFPQVMVELWAAEMAKMYEREPYFKIRLGIERYWRLERILQQPYWWLRERLVGTMNVWIYGYCKDCPQDEEDWQCLTASTNK